MRAMVQKIPATIAALAQLEDIANGAVDRTGLQPPR